MYLLNLSFKYHVSILSYILSVILSKTIYSLLHLSSGYIYLSFYKVLIMYNRVNTKCFLYTTRVYENM